MREARDPSTDRHRGDAARPNAAGLRLPERRATDPPRRRRRRSDRPLRAPRRPSTGRRSWPWAASTRACSRTGRTSTWCCGCGWPGPALRPRSRGARNPRPLGDARLRARSRKNRLMGFGRGYVLRKWGVLRDPRRLAQVLATDGAVCLGQIAVDRSVAGNRRQGARVSARRRARRPFRPRRWTRRRARWDAPDAPPAGTAPRPPEPRTGRGPRPSGLGGSILPEPRPRPVDIALAAKLATLSEQGREPAKRLHLSREGRSQPSRGARFGERPHLGERDPRNRLSGHELDLSRQPVAGHEPRVLGTWVPEACAPGRRAAMPNHSGRLEAKSPPRRPRANVQVDVLTEGEVTLVVAAEMLEELASERDTRPRRRRRPRAGPSMASARRSPAPSSRPRPSAVSAWPAL